MRIEYSAASIAQLFFRDFIGFSEVLPHIFWTSCRVSSGPGILNYIFDGETSLLQWGILAVHWKIWKMIEKHDFINARLRTDFQIFHYVAQMFHSLAHNAL